MALLVDLYAQYNPVTDWTALAGAVHGTYLKYSDGTGGAHIPADAYASGCRAHSIPYGGYHYAQPGNPVAQADVLIGQYRRLGGALAPALDLESGGIPTAARVPFARAFLERVHAAYPVVVLYASGSWLASLSPGTWGYPWLRTWIAEYGANTGTRNPPRAYGGPYDLHQYTSVGTLPGVTGNVDLDHTTDPTRLYLGDTVSFTDVIGHRKDGTTFTAGDALANLYLGAYYGGGDAGVNPVYPTVSSILAVVNALVAQLKALLGDMTAAITPAVQTAVTNALGQEDQAQADAIAQHIITDVVAKLSAQ